MNPTGNGNGARSFTPVRVLELALEDPLPSLPAPTAAEPHRRAQILVRLHDVPLGMIQVEIPECGVSAAELAQVIWSELGQAIDEHLRADGVTEPSAASADGVGRAAELPRCQRERDAFLERAPAITVLIPSRERPERLRRCVESILACSYPGECSSVLVVDNNPETSRTRELVEELAAATGRVRYAREDAPGSASARNRGLQLVDTELVAMTDDDVIVDRHWLTEVARAFDAYPSAGAVSGLLFPAELESEAQVWFEQYGGFGRGYHRRVFDLDRNRPPDEPLYPWNAGLFGTGNNFSFRTEALKGIGGFDPALGNGTPALGGVDSEVLLRTILSGYQIVYEPNAIAHHAHRPDYDGLRRQVYGYGTGLVAYYLKTILAEPRFALDFARKLPVGLRWMLSADAHVNKYKLEDYPPELTWLERRGMLYGPLAYARSRRQYGRHAVYRRRERRLAGL
ncbi:MAG TPA: glycosyltransferase family 2 protein [Solirubrobacteraceae bacterium]|jgi:GT2 family glycosyltransferase